MITSVVRGGGTTPVPVVEDEILAVVVETAPDATIVFDDQGVMELVDLQIVELFGYATTDLVGRSLEMLFPQVGSLPLEAPLRLSGRHAKGSEVAVEISVREVRTSAGIRFIAAVRDVTARLDLDSEASEVRRVLDATGDAVLMFDPGSLRFTYVNDGAIAQLGYSHDELSTMTVLDIKPLFTEAEFRGLIDGLGPGASYNYTTVHRHKDGSDIPVEAVLQRPVGHLGGPGWMVSIARDVTLRLEMERRAHLAQRDIAVLEDRHRIANDLHDRVIQRLFATGLGIETIRGGELSPHLSEQLADLVDDLDGTIRELRSSIFDLTRLAATESLRSAVLDVCAHAQVPLGFNPAVHFDGPVEDTDPTTGEQLLAVLREALANVARHAEAKAVQVTIKAGERLQLIVKDDGVGLRPRLVRSRRIGEKHGLTDMTTRAENLGGSCWLRSAGPPGAVLEWNVPITDDALGRTQRPLRKGQT